MVKLISYGLHLRNHSNTAVSTCADVCLGLDCKFWQSSSKAGI